MAVMQGDAHHTFQTLLHDDLNSAVQVQDEAVCKTRYQEELGMLVKTKEHETSPWIVHR